MARYYYMKDGKKEGPIAADDLFYDLRDGYLPRDTQVCADDSATWIPISALPDSVFSPKVLDEARDLGTQDGANNKRNDLVTLGDRQFTRPEINKAIRNASIIGLIIVVWVVLAIVTPRTPKSQSDSAQPPSKSEIIAKLRRNYPPFQADGTTLITKKQELFRLIGEPTRTSSAGNDSYLYYECQDGTIQIVADRFVLEQGMVVGKLNDY